MNRLKYIGGLVIAIILFGVVWQAHPANERANQLESQLSGNYVYINYLLQGTVEELLEWNFSEPLQEADETYLRQLSMELYYTTSLVFSGPIVHWEWRNRLDELERYLMEYTDDGSLSEEDIADLHQALQATRFITMDLTDFAKSSKGYYDAMHNEQHEMVERIKQRLATEY